MPLAAREGVGNAKSAKQSNQSNIWAFLSKERKESGCMLTTDPHNDAGLLQEYQVINTRAYPLCISQNIEFFALQSKLKNLWTTGV
jgi:hypothetical protein